MSLLYTLTIVAFLAFIYQWFAKITLDNARFKDGLIYGIGATFIVQSIVRDVVGQHVYISIVNASWISSSVTLPLSILALLVMSGILFIGFRIAIPANEKVKQEVDQKKKDENNV